MFNDGSLNSEGYVSAGYSFSEQSDFNISDNKNDICSLGIILYELITGRYLSVDRKIDLEFENKYPELAKVIRKCIIIDCMERYINIEQLSSDLLKYQEVHTGRVIVSLDEDFANRPTFYDEIIVGKTKNIFACLAFDKGTIAMIFFMIIGMLIILVY